jgi:hypothetical protein
MNKTTGDRLGDGATERKSKRSSELHLHNKSRITNNKSRVTRLRYQLRRGKQITNHGLYQQHPVLRFLLELSPSPHADSGVS